MDFEPTKIDDSGIFTQGSDGFVSTSPENSNDSHTPPPTQNPFTTTTPLSTKTYPNLDTNTPLALINKPIPERPEETSSPSGSHTDSSRSNSPQPIDTTLSPDDQQDQADLEYLKSISTPKQNAHGKVKPIKCKNCNFVSITKIQFWTHLKEHIRPEKRLTCQRCPFVTEYKHHLEYHLRNHFKSKPYQCNRCNYTCVNKSMLNSHKKSHLDIYQYRCATCNYVTKYCHSLKLHLRKYTHEPDIVLNTDGTPNPLPIIDVYGTRRGPKQRPTEKKKRTKSPKPDVPQISQISPVPYVPQPHFLLPENQQAAAALHAMQLFNRFGANPFFQNQIEPFHCPHCEFATFEMSVIMEHIQMHRVPESVECMEPVPGPSHESKNRRKGKACKVEQSQLELQYVNKSSEDEEDGPGLAPIQEEPLNMSRSPSLGSPDLIIPEVKIEEVSDNEDEAKDKEPNNNKEGGGQLYVCEHCDIVFKNVVMYSMHKGYHDRENPYRCNMCGIDTKDKVSFFVHIARHPHL